MDICRGVQRNLKGGTKLIKKSVFVISLKKCPKRGWGRTGPPPPPPLYAFANIYVFLFYENMSSTFDSPLGKCSKRLCLVPFRRRLQPAEQQYGGVDGLRRINVFYLTANKSQSYFVAASANYNFYTYRNSYVIRVSAVTVRSKN